MWFVCRNQQNGAGKRLLLACLLAKAHRPEVDIRKPYTEIGDPDTFSGRTYDEQVIGPFIHEHSLPCNQTTAFLTPALRNRNVILTSDLNLVGRPPQLYQTVLQLLDDVYRERVDAELLLAAAIQCLITFRDELFQQIQSLLTQLPSPDEALSLSAESIVILIQNHLALPKSSRLPVLVVAAAYQAVSMQIGAVLRPLNAHNAADKQTGALGDIELTLIAENDVIASYEMKDKRISKIDIDTALAKVMRFRNASGKNIGHYVFITTNAIDRDVADYAASLYTSTNGIEFVILDCIGFLRHFLHLFHRFRMQFLEAYQELLLIEPNSAVSDAMKEAFLSMRIAAEAGME